MRAFGPNLARLRRLVLRVCLTVISGVAVLSVALAGCYPAPIDNPTDATPLPTPEGALTATPLAVVTPTPTIQSRPTPVPARTFPPSMCAPPCWQGIIPGKTTIDEAQRVLGEPDWKGWGEKVDGKIVVVDQWGMVQITRDRQTPLEWEQVSLISQDRVVKGIVLTDPDGRDTLADVVARYGTPEYVLVEWIHPEAPYWHATLVYLSKGLTFNGDTNMTTAHCDRETMPPISKSDAVVWTSYYEPTNLDQASVNRYGELGQGSIKSKRVEWRDIPD